MVTAAVELLDMRNLATGWAHKVHALLWNPRVWSCRYLVEGMEEEVLPVNWIYIVFLEGSSCA
jgi:hypothetical protein